MILQIVLSIFPVTRILAFQFVEKLDFPCFLEITHNFLQHFSQTLLSQHRSHLARVLPRNHQEESQADETRRVLEQMRQKFIGDMLDQRSMVLKQPHQEVLHQQQTPLRR